MEKKQKKIWKKVLILALVILVLILVATLRKFIIFTKLENTGRNIKDSNNYYVEIRSLQGDSLGFTKSYNKDSKYITTRQFYSKDIDTIRRLTIYDDNKEHIGFIQSGENKVALMDKNVLGGEVKVNTFSTYDMGNWLKFQLAFLSKIRTEECNNTECYVIEFAQGWRQWIDKKTGLIIREINNDIMTNYSYEFDVVKDEDISKPDISEYKVQK